MPPSCGNSGDGLLGLPPISQNWMMGKFTGNPYILMVKTMVSCRFSLIIFFDYHNIFDGTPIYFGRDGPDS